MKLPNHTTDGRPLVVLFDAMALAYRAYFAFITRPLTNARGENTSAVYGFMTALFQFLDHHAPAYAAVCFDTPHPTFRHKRFEAYKATRQAMPDDLPPQLEKIKEIIRAFRIPMIEVPGFEADDIIGTLARMAEQAGMESLLVTPDKDFCQLVGDHVKILRPSRDGGAMEIYDTEMVRQKYGLEPKQIIDYLALVGDASDNIPGVRGIGEKTAAPLLQKFGSLANLYEHIAEVDKKGIKDKLTNERDNAFLSYELATIDTSVTLPLTLEGIRYGVLPDFDALDLLVHDLGFKSLANRLHQLKEDLLKSESSQTLEMALAPEDTTKERTEEEQLEAFDFAVGPSTEEQDIHSWPHAYVMIRTIEGVHELAKLLAEQHEFCVDLESTGQDANTAEIIGISFAVKPGEAFYIPIHLPDIGSDIDATSLFEHTPPSSAENALTMGLPLADVLNVLRPVLENEHIGKVGQNIKYDALLLRHNGVHMRPLTFDTMIAAYLYRFDGSHSMDALSIEHLKYRPVPLADVVGQLKDGTARRSMAIAPTVKLAKYGAEDADVTLRLRHVLAPKLEEVNVAKLCKDVEFPLVEVLTQMEYHGVKIDSELLGLASKEMEREAENLCRQIYEYAGGPFNIDSPKQLQEILFTKLGLQSGRKTKTGLSTAANVLEDLRHEHPIAECLLSYRQYQKLRGTYVDALPRMVNPKTGMVHTSYNQAVVATGRISSTDPNLQNIPIKTEMGRDIRKAFVSRFKHGQILSADYSQIELRIMAHVTRDAGLIEAFSQGQDIHTRTAAGIFGVPLEEVTREMRGKAKGVNYGIMYGIGAFGLARNVRITQKEASEIIQKYFAAFPLIRKYMDDTIKFARTNGYVETLLGRRRYMRNISAANQAVRSADERAAINAPIQGTAADMMKLAMIDIHREMARRNMRSIMIMQVHDELVFDVVPEEADEMMPLVKGLMSNAMPMVVPIDVEAGIGPTWFEAH
ncbi:MAG: DNA polymerase I [Bacteroidota bacterium]|nr:DNA polymerase I [Bacteroidota bacterium]MDP4233175.1 DNA polymerase I [Bacteroidota bacterium]MDP4241680.1 DNA polymerase I [Bacteroidota bacterium]MDP4287338.1 DNA polymerase I [Bacteroidota bacterium]